MFHSPVTVKWTIACAGLMTERLQVQIPVGAVGEFSSPWSTFCADSYFGIRSTPVLPQQHIKIPVILPKVQVAGYSFTHMYPTYVASNEVTP